MLENNLSREGLLFRVNNVDKIFYINKYYLAVTMEIPLYRNKYVFKLYNALDSYRSLSVAVLPRV